MTRQTILAIEQRHQSIRVVRDNAVNAQIEQTLHILHVVDRPDMNFEITLMSAFNKSVGR